MKSILLVAALFASTAMARTITCPNVGQFDINADVVDINYVATMGINPSRDMGYFEFLDKDNSYYRTQNWGATVAIPNALVTGNVLSDRVLFSVPNAEDVADICTQN
jgi:hypothetical protein